MTIPKHMNLTLVNPKNTKSNLGSPCSPLFNPNLDYQVPFSPIDLNLIHPSKELQERLIEQSKLAKEENLFESFSQSKRSAKRSANKGNFQNAYY